MHCKASVGLETYGSRGSLITYFNNHFPVLSEHLSVNIVAVLLLEKTGIRKFLQEIQNMLVEDVLSVEEIGLEASRVSLGYHSCHERTPARSFEHRDMGFNGEWQKSI